MTQKEQAKAAKNFAERWQGHGYEKGEAQSFWIDLLTSVFGLQNFVGYIKFEEQVQKKGKKGINTNFIDGYIPETHVLIEHKSSDIDLRKPDAQTGLNAFEQARKYKANLPYSQTPKWIVTCNFTEFLVYDMERPLDEPVQIFLKDLEKEYYRLSFLVDETTVHLQKEQELTFKSGDLVGLLYDKLKVLYGDETDENLKNLNKLCVRLVFCLYAEDAGLFGKKSMFGDYLKRYNPDDLRDALLKLFCILDQKEENRKKHEKPELLDFPYVNGGLFENADADDIPQLTEEIKTLLVTKASDDFDWSRISPTIFGSLFESTLNKETRKNNGMHYTSIENIHKVIDPLFMNDLNARFDEAKRATGKERSNKLKALQTDLSRLKFLDPACGSGNFLTETYLSLRRLENKILKELSGGTGYLNLGDVIKVNIEQFYGIEINDFAVAVAKTALWIAESQMKAETESIVNQDISRLPLKSNSNIVEANALRIDWNTICPTEQLSYIIGNPPFAGQKKQTDEQKTDLAIVFGSKHKGLKMLDYVAGWYKKAADIMKGTNIRTALVSTNSICQGESIEDLWASLFKEGVHVDFAHRTFRWDNDAKDEAKVHCVIVGFSLGEELKEKFIYDNGKVIKASHINGHLADSGNMVLPRCGTQISGAPDMTKGAQLIDGGGFMLKTEAEKEEFLSKYPEAEPYIYRYYNAKDLLNDKPAKYCLYLKHCPPQLMKNCKGIRDKIQAVYDYRANSDAKTTQQLKDSPSQFFQSQVPEHQSIVIPVVSSENRQYIPMCLMPVGNVYTNALFYVDNGDLYLFGILTSNVHMSWMRAICGRLESRYRYSNDIVYNNFPFPKVTEQQKLKIIKTAQAILDTRTQYIGSSLADLYDKLTLPKDLLRAHQANDEAVMEAYGFDAKMNEKEIVRKLYEKHEKIITSQHTTKDKTKKKTR